MDIILTGGLNHCESNAPKDLHVIELLEHNPSTDTWKFVAESQEFNPVTEGCDAERFDLEFNRIEDD